MATARKDISHQVSVLNVDHYGSKRNMDGDMNQRIAVTPHSVIIMIYRAIFHQINVSKDALIEVNMGTSCAHVAN